jgi:hypothetical protein
MQRFGYLLALAVLGAACGKGVSEPKPAPSASASSAAPPSSAASAAAPSTAPPAPTAACRALRVTGEAKLGDGGGALESGSLLDGSQWVTLGEGARVTLKHTASGRELALAGPARFRACSRGREQLLLARGSVTAVAGPGARPGAEVLIATPVAAVHYGDAELSLLLDAKRLRVAVRAGSVEVEPLPIPKKPIKSPLRANDELTLSLGKPDVTELMSACKAAAEAADAAARRVADGSSQPLGERAQAHVRARKAARASCTVAAAATGLVADPTESAGLWAEAVRWEAVWESIPRRARAQAAEK